MSESLSRPFSWLIQEWNKWLSLLIRYRIIHSNSSKHIGIHSITNHPCVLYETCNGSAWTFKEYFCWVFAEVSDIIKYISSHILHFIVSFTEPVPKPEITIEESSNPDVVYLRCAYSEKIIWKKSSGEQLEGKKNQDPGEFITVKNTRNPENFYTCTLKNAVSEEISDPVSERQLFRTGKTANYLSITFQRRKSDQNIYIYIYI